MFVIDASIALTWCFADEATEATDRLFERVRDAGAVVPWIWRVEVANSLLQAERRGRIGGADVAARLRLMSDLPIRADVETHATAWEAILPLARAERLTTYDAVYLEVSIRRGLPLATLDQALAAAAARRGVAIL